MKNGLLTKLIIFSLLTISILSQDFYQLLEITRDSTPKEMKKNYRRLSKVYHPDKNQGNKDL